MKEAANAMETDVPISASGRSFDRLRNPSPKPVQNMIVR